MNSIRNILICFYLKVYKKNLNVFRHILQSILFGILALQKPSREGIRSSDYLQLDTVLKDSVFFSNVFNTQCRAYWAARSGVRAEMISVVGFSR